MTTAASLTGLVPTNFREVAQHTLTEGAGADSTPKVWRLAEAYVYYELGTPNPHTQSVELLRRWFGYVLVECPTMRQITAPYQISNLCDGVFLVVAAGHTKRDEIVQAQQLLDASSFITLGVILNKQTHPVPGFVSKYL